MSIDYNLAAEQDILETVDALVDGYGPTVATAFRNRLQRTLAGLEALPHSGSPVDPPFPNYPGMRFRPVNRFTSRVVYYLPTPTGIRVVRVLHAHQNTGYVFGD